MDGTRRGISQLRALSKDGFVRSHGPGTGLHANVLGAPVRTDDHPATLWWKVWP